MSSKNRFSCRVGQWLIASIAALAMPLQAQPWIVGDAASADNGELLYREIHYRSDASASLSERVEYVLPSGELIVEKTLNGARSSITPEVEQNDLRSGTRFSISDSGDSLDARYRRGDQGFESRRIEKEERLVVDAGFDPYVRANWQALRNGETIRAEFFVPARLDTIKISIRETDAEQCAALESSALCLVVRPAGILRLVGWLVEPLYLAYEQDSQRLLMYRGISNLLDENGQSQNVVIRYRYSNTAG
tara:strand:+ start:1216 stop:1962 length:747 start_codon:yes stop_codon:yes gene_type:complete